MIYEEKVQLRDLCVKIGSGATPRGGKEAYKGGDTSLIRSQNVYNEGFSRDGLVYIDDDQSSKLQNIVVEPNDVLLNITGDSVARCCQVADDVIPSRVNQHVAIIRPKPDKLDARFLRYLLISHEYQSQLLALASAGATRPALTKGMIEELSIPNTPLPTQKSIAHILGTLDDKIEQNRRMNETLEEMARAIFKSWFVDFDPVIDNALRAGNPIPEEFEERAARRRALLDQPSSSSCSTPLLPNLGKLFPDSFRDSELGPIPEGWEAKPLTEILTINPSIKLSKGTVAPFADMKALPTKGYAIEGVIEKAYSGGAKFQNGDVLLARITPCLENGKTGIVDFLSDNAVGFGSTEFIVLRGRGEIKLPYVACLAREESFRLHCMQSMVGSSGRQRVQNACFESFYLAIPSESIVLKKFSEIASSMFRKSSEQSKEVFTLSKLRNTLLPRLISGELSASLNSV